MWVATPAEDLPNSRALPRYAGPAVRVSGYVKAYITSFVALFAAALLIALGASLPPAHAAARGDADCDGGVTAMSFTA